MKKTMLIFAMALPAVAAADSTLVKIYDKRHGDWRAECFRDRMSDETWCHASSNGQIPSAKSAGDVIALVYFNAGGAFRMQLMGLGHAAPDKATLRVDERPPETSARCSRSSCYFTGDVPAATAAAMMEGRELLVRLNGPRTYSGVISLKGFSAAAKDAHAQARARNAI